MVRFLGTGSARQPSTSVVAKSALRWLPAAILAITSLSISMPVAAFNGILSDWQARYGAISASGDNANCQLCHESATGGGSWNAYGWDIRLARENVAACDIGGNGSVSNEEAFFCVEPLNSDGDGSGYTNLDEIGVSTQPGWTNGANNTIFSDTGTLTGQLPPDDIGALDPDGTEPPPPVEPPPPGEDEDLPPGQHKRQTIVVRPGQSIQKAIDQAAHGARIYVLAGTYRELSDPVNGLRINKSGIRLIGQKTPNKQVVLENAGNQRNGIVVVPEERNDCLECHVSMAPPFDLYPDVEPGMNPEPALYDIEIRNIVISNFTNNGLFTERVDGFKIVNVESRNNKNYGIFPTLSRNGLVTRSKATGADDSGIWVETSENVRVTHNLVEGNTNGIEVSNSDDIELSYNVARGNTSAFAILLLPDIFDDRAGAKRIDMRNNWLMDNNKPNTARPGSILATVPPGTGILHLGVDDSVIENNYIADNGLGGIVIADYCLTVAGTPFACDQDPTVTPEFIADNFATNNRVLNNVLVNNGTNPPGSPFDFAASDLILLTLGEWGNCYSGNDYTTHFSTLGPYPGILPPCAP